MEDFSMDNINKIGLNGVVEDFFVDYNAIDTKMLRYP